MDTHAGDAPEEITQSLLRQGFRRQIYVSFHGPAHITISPVVRDFMDEFGIPILYLDLTMQMFRSGGLTVEDFHAMTVGAYESGAAGYYFGEKSDHMSTPRIETASRGAELAERGKQAISRLVDSLDMENIVSQLRDLKEFEDTVAERYPWVHSAFSRRH